MYTTQTTLTDDPGEIATTEEASSSSTNRMYLAPPDKRGGDGCCPWCLAAAQTFERGENGRVRCGHCDAAIPINAKWYERGEKIVL